MNNFNKKKKLIYRKFFIGYCSFFCIPFFFLSFSLLQGAGWKPIISGIPLYVTIFIGLTYQFIKELRALAREERGEPEPPPKKNYWEQD